MGIGDYVSHEGVYEINYYYDYGDVGNEDDYEFLFGHLNGFYLPFIKI